MQSACRQVGRAVSASDGMQMGCAVSATECSGMQSASSRQAVGMHAACRPGTPCPPPIQGMQHATAS